MITPAGVDVRGFGENIEPGGIERGEAAVGSAQEAVTPRLASQYSPVITPPEVNAGAVGTVVDVEPGTSIVVIVPSRAPQEAVPHATCVDVSFR